MSVSLDNKIELISFKLCPFANRSVVTMLQKDVDFDMTYVDIFNTPEWFKEISPMGKVPVLRLDGKAIFESAIINELIDDITPGQLQPEDPLVRAHNRAWIEFGGNLLMEQFYLFMGADEDGFKTKMGDVRDLLKKLDAQVDGEPYFNGKSFSLIDAAYAPLFIRFAIVDAIVPLGLLDGLPDLQRWSSALLACQSVQNSIVPDFTDLFLDFFGSGHMVKSHFGDRAKSGMGLPFSLKKDSSSKVA